MAITINRTTSLDGAILPEFMPGLLYMNENQAHKFVITCTRGGSAVTLTGGITGRFMRADGQTILLSGSISSGKANLTLPQSCYIVPGRFTMAIFNVTGNAVTTIYALTGNVARTQTDTLVDPGNTVPTIDNLLAEIDAMRQATADAEAAATKAVRYDTTQSLTDANKTTARGNIDAAGLAQVVRHDAAQSLTNTQKATARGNIDAPSNADLDEVKTGMAVRFDADQNLSETQKSTARGNIDAVGLAQVVRHDAAQSLTDAQKTVARNNIDAASAGIIENLEKAFTYNPSFANQTLMISELVKNTQRDNYIHPSISGGTVNKLGTNGFFIPTGVFNASATEAYITYADFSLVAGQKYTMFVRYQPEISLRDSIGISIKGKREGSIVNTVVQTDLGGNAATREKNTAFVFTAKYNYSDCYINLYKSAGEELVFDNFIIYVYLAPGEWVDIDFDTLYKIPNSYRSILQSPYYNMSAKIVNNNLVEGTQFSEHRVHGAMTVDKVFYSGFLLNGTLENGLRNYISRGDISLDATKKYTMYIKTNAYMKNDISFSLRSASRAEYVTTNGVRVATRVTNNVYKFTPDVSDNDVYISVYQNTGLPMVFDNFVVYIYIVEGDCNAEDFDYTYNIINNEDASIDVSPRVKANNIVDGTQYIYSETSGSLVIDKVHYSGFRINGDLYNESRRYISMPVMNLDTSKDYTMFIKTTAPISNNIAFSLAYGTGVDTQYVLMNGENVSTRQVNNVYYFRPDENYSNVYLNLWQNTGDVIALDNMIVYIYIVEGRYTNEDFDPNGKYAIYRYQKRSVAYGLNVGLPIISLHGDIASMTKDNALAVDWYYNFDSGSATMKWQGASSIAYSKKNYSIKFDKKIDFGWGEQKKYVLKANYIDNTNSLNVCSAKLWASIVANRGTNPAIEVGANNGAMDGFPVIVLLNGEFFGLYTLNTPKDQWTFGMDESLTEWIVTAEDHTQATRFKAETTLEGDDFELEYAADGVALVTVANALNLLIDTVINSTGTDWEDSVSPYIDIDSVVDYMIYSALITNIDGIDKNFILTTYDGVKWWINAYDVDSTFGLFWNGGSYVKTTDASTSFAGQNATSRLFHLVYRYSTAKLIARYDELRGTLLSEDNIYNLFYNFCSAIPNEVVNIDNKLYPYKPGTYTETVSRIMENYRLRCKFIDAEIDELRNSLT